LLHEQCFTRKKCIVLIQEHVSDSRRMSVGLYQGLYIQGLYIQRRRKYSLVASSRKLNRSHSTPVVLTALLSRSVRAIHRVVEQCFQETAKYYIFVDNSLLFPTVKEFSKLVNS